MMLLQHHNLKNITLTVSKDISETGNLFINENGTVELPPDSAKKLLAVPGFSLIENQSTEPVTGEEVPQLSEQPKKRGRRPASERD